MEGMGTESHCVGRIHGVSIWRLGRGNFWKGKGTKVDARSVSFMNGSSIPGWSMSMSMSMSMKNNRKAQQYLSVRCEVDDQSESNTNNIGFFTSIVKRVKEAIHRYNEERALIAELWHIVSLRANGHLEPSEYEFGYWVINEINRRENKNLELNEVISYEGWLPETGKCNTSLLAMDEQGMHIYDVVVCWSDGKKEFEYSERPGVCEETFTQGAVANMKGSQDSSIGM